MVSPYNTNFHKEKSGNSLPVGNDLRITITDNPTVLTGVLKIRKSFGRKQVIQIEQSGRRSNPEKNSITFEMKDRRGEPFPPGKYHVHTKANYYPKAWEKDWKDDFEVV